MFNETRLRTTATKAPDSGAFSHFPVIMSIDLATRNDRQMPVLSRQFGPGVPAPAGHRDWLKVSCPGAGDLVGVAVVSRAAGCSRRIGADTRWHAVPDVP